MKRLVKYIFIPVLAILLMSHNVSAINTVFDISDYSPYQQINAVSVSCSFGGATVLNTSGYTCGYTPNVSSTSYSWLYDITSNDSYTFKKGDLVNFHLFIRTWDVDNLNISQPILSYFGSANNDFDFVAYDIIAEKEVYSLNTGNYSWPDETSPGQIDLEDFGQYYSTYSITLRAKRDFTGSFGIHGSNNERYSLYLFGNLPNSQPSVNRFRIYVANVSFLRKNKSQVNEEQTDATQDAADDSSTAGNSSQSSAEGATSNLLSVFSGFANVITNASATNCVINAPLNTSFSNDVFNVDLCGLDLPPAIGALTSIIAVMVVVPFAISMFNKFIGIMESFQK